MNRNLQRFPDVPLGVEIVTHGPVAVAVAVVVVVVVVVVMSSVAELR